MTPEQIAALIERLRKLTDRQRVDLVFEILQVFCPDCGREYPEGVPLHER